MRVHLLGSGGALTSVQRGNTSLAISTEERTILIECSGTPSRSLQQHDLEWTAIEDLFVTHRHPDHLFGLPSLLQQVFIATLPEGRGPLRVHGPENAIEVASGLLDAVGLTTRADMFEIRFEPLPLEDHTTTLEDLVVTSFPVSHGSVPALGLKVSRKDAPRGAVVYSGDTELCDAVVEHCEGADLLLHECSTYAEDDTMAGHTALGRISELVERVDVERIVLVHLPPVSAKEEGAVRRQLKRSFGTRVILGEDGRSWEV